MREQEAGEAINGMARPNSGKKRRLRITRCTIESAGETKPMTGDANIFKAMINPDTYSRSYGIGYTDKQCKLESDPIGCTSVELNFAAIKKETVSFHLVIDGTGVVKLFDKVPDVKEQLEKLKDIVYRYQGEKHEPSVVQLSWGDIDEDNVAFVGRMTSMKVDYTMFKPSGAPLRAKVALSFGSYMTRAESALRANQSSPDMSHVVQVRAGDSLPALCHRIYNDSSQYMTVARANGLSGFRELSPGMRLRFPPIKKNSSRAKAPSA